MFKTFQVLENWRNEAEVVVAILKIEIKAAKTIQTREVHLLILVNRKKEVVEDWVDLVIETTGTAIDLEKLVRIQAASPKRKISVKKTRLLKDVVEESTNQKIEVLVEKMYLMKDFGVEATTPITEVTVEAINLAKEI